MLPLRILVLGHGYLGSELVRCLHANEESFVAVHRGPSDSDAPYPLITADVTDLHSLTELGQGLQQLGYTPNWIVHCASSGRGGADAYRTVFVEGVRNLSNVFAGTPILFTSSTSVYGQKDGSVVTEDSETRPERETGRILLEAEGLVRKGGGSVLRLAGLYGPGRSIYLERLFLGTIAIEDSEPSRFLNQLHRDDAVSAILHVLRMDRRESVGKIWNVVDDEPMTQRECCERLADRFGLPEPQLVPPDPGRKRGWTNKAVSNASLRSTGWGPCYPSFLSAIDSDPRIALSIREQIEDRD